MAEWYCNGCRKWNGRSICTACLRINPADARWMTEREIRGLRQWAMGAKR